MQRLTEGAFPSIMAVSTTCTPTGAVVGPKVWVLTTGSIDWKHFTSVTSQLLFLKQTEFLSREFNSAVFCYCKTKCPSCVAVVRSSKLNTQTCLNETYIPFNTWTSQRLMLHVCRLLAQCLMVMCGEHTNSPRVSWLLRDLQEFVIWACKKKAWAWVCWAPSIWEGMFPGSLWPLL